MFQEESFHRFTHKWRIRLRRVWTVSGETTLHQKYIQLFRLCQTWWKLRSQVSGLTRKHEQPNERSSRYLGSGVISHDF